MKYFIYDNNKVLLVEIHSSNTLHMGDFVNIKGEVYLINSLQWVIETKSAGGFYDYSDLQSCIVICTKV